MNLVAFFLASLGLRFLIFDHIHMRWFRNLCCKTWVLRFLCNCPFCQGVWTGAIICGIDGRRDWRVVVTLVLASAIVSMLYVVMFDHKVDEWESRKAAKG